MISRSQDWWDNYFLGKAEYVAQASKDPSRKVGAVLAQGKNDIASGYNGFPPGIIDSLDRLEDRELKYQIVLHAEDNCLHYAGDKAKGGTLYVWGIAPCSNCASRAIRSGVARVVVQAPINERWYDNNLLASKLFSEAGITFKWIQE